MCRGRHCAEGARLPRAPCAEGAIVPRAPCDCRGRHCAEGAKNCLGERPPHAGDARTPRTGHTEQNPDRSRHTGSGTGHGAEGGKAERRVGVAADMLPCPVLHVGQSRDIGIRPTDTYTPPRMKMGAGR